MVVASVTMLAAACSGDSGAPTVEPVTTAAGGTATTAAATGPAPAGSRAVQGLLTVDDLPAGWKAGAPTAGGGTSTAEFDTPECAALAALHRQPGTRDNASVDLTSPDDGTSVTQSVLVASAADAKAAYDTAAAPSTAQCLTSLFTKVFNDPAQLPQGTKLDHVDIHPATRHAGDEAAGFEGLIVVKQTGSGDSIEVPVRFDVVRTGSAVGLLLFVAVPSAEAVDADGLLTAAATKMATVG